MWRKVFLIGLIAIISVSGYVVLTAADGIHDGRINTQDYAGGTAIFCVDASDVPSGSFESGGAVKVLSHSGQQLLHAPGEAIAPLVAQANAGTLAQNALLDSGPNAFGTGRLQLLLLRNGQLQLSGVDMHGSYFEFNWLGCETIRSQDSGDSVPGPMSTEEV